MKYMTFRASCAYAGVANMLERYGVDTDDRTIALSIGLPYLFSYDNGVYQAGPMLQSAEWFNLYLHPIGFHMSETCVSAHETAAFLRCHDTAMLGLAAGEAGRHAVVYTGCGEGRFKFLNNKWAHEDTPETFLLTEDELLERLEVSAMIAVLERRPPVQEEPIGRIRESEQVLDRNFEEICAVCQHEETIAALRGKMNTLFRPLLLDGITMLELIGESELAAQLAAVQRSFLNALRQETDRRIVLADALPMKSFAEAVQAYARLIRMKTA